MSVSLVKVLAESVLGAEKELFLTLVCSPAWLTVQLHKPKYSLKRKGQEGQLQMKQGHIKSGLR